MIYTTLCLVMEYTKNTQLFCRQTTDAVIKSSIKLQTSQKAGMRRVQRVAPAWQNYQLSKMNSIKAKLTGPSCVPASPLKI